MGKIPGFDSSENQLNSYLCSREGGLDLQVIIPGKGARFSLWGEAVTLPQNSPAGSMDADRLPIKRIKHERT